MCRDPVLGPGDHWGHFRTPRLPSLDLRRVVRRAANPRARSPWRRRGRRDSRNRRSGRAGAARSGWQVAARDQLGRHPASTLSLWRPGSIDPAHRSEASRAPGAAGREAAGARRAGHRQGCCLSMESRASPRPGGLSCCVAFSQLLGLAAVAVTGAWLGLYRGGIAWESDLQFNAHPLCMIIGLVFLQADALLVYRVFRSEAKRTTKILHGLLHGCAFVIALVGLVAVFDYHRRKGYADLYSLHSWCGILAFVLFVAQWLVGFGFFLFPGASFSPRSRYRPLHIFFGAATFLLSVGTALLGLKEALLFKLGATYSTFEPEGVLANVLGLLLAGFALVVLYILTRPEWKRPPQAEEQALSMDFKTLTEGDSPSSQ